MLPDKGEAVTDEKIKEMQSDRWEVREGRQRGMGEEGM